MSGPNDYELFETLKKSVALFDPVAFAEDNLTIDGRPFRMSGTGWKFMTEVYRYVAAQAGSVNAKPVVMLKSRQIGATILAAVLSLYFTSSGIYGGDRPPMRILHAFPTLGLMGLYAKDKLDPMIRGSQNGFLLSRSLKNDKNIGTNIPEDTQTEKNFIGFNKLRVDSLGRDADRIRGFSGDGVFFDECFPYNQYIEIENGKQKIGSLYRMWSKNKDLPLVKSYNEEKSVFEYKKILHAWKRDKRPLVELTCGRRKIRCTPEHKFLTDTGWKMALHLKAGDLLKSSSASHEYIRALNDDQLQITLGSFLGNGTLSSHKEGVYSLRATYRIEHKDYCQWKADMFNTKTHNINKSGYTQTPTIQFCSESFGLPILPKTKTACPQWLLDQLNERGLAIWFMDNGSVQEDGYGAKISIHSFDQDSKKRIIKRLQAFGIECSYERHADRHYAIINKSGYKKLNKIISRYIHDSMRYKLDESSYGNLKYVWGREFNNYGFICVDSVMLLPETESVYDIEVEGNHNFIVTSTGLSKNLGGPIASNCQDMSKAAVENTLPVLTASQYGPPTQGIQLFFGTPKETGSFLWELWEGSDQRYYQPRCSDCHHYFFLYKIGEEYWRKIWLHGYEIECPECGCIQDKRVAIDKGRWIPTKENAKYVGFHMNVILNPMFTKEAVLLKDPEMDPHKSVRAWKNETLGEFYSGSGSPLTAEELLANSLMPERGIVKSIRPHSGRIITMGVDWGDKADEDEVKRGKSYTAVVIMSSDADGKFIIENAFRLPRTDWDYKVRVIQELIKRFNVSICIADYGFGNDIVNHIQRDLKYGKRFIGCISSGSLKTTISYNQRDMRITVNKDLMVDDVFALFKKGYIKMPAKGESYDALWWLVENCTSMESKSVDRNGNKYKTYIKGNGPNDGLMALMYAVIGYRFLSTNEFKHRGVKDQKTGITRPLPIGAYAPALKF